MKRVLIICGALLSLSVLSAFLLSGCMSEEPAAAGSLGDEIEAEVRSALRENEDSWSAWAKEWKDWSEGTEDPFYDEGKAHRWRILDAEGQELAVVSDEKQVEALDQLLLHDNDSWDRPGKEMGEPGLCYVYSQEKTPLAGQDPDEEREYEDLMSFTLSETEDVMTLRVLGGLEEMSLLPGVEMEDVLTFSVSVPTETAEALRDPDRFSK